MGPLNYHHLHYFWVVAREGGIAAASRKLHVGRPAISAQLKSLETAIGSALFERRGRHLDLTETGQLVLDYANEIFPKGEELADVLRGRAPARGGTLRVGIADVMMKLAAFRILEPCLELAPTVQLVCREGPPASLFGALAVHELDLVLSDVAPPAEADVRVRVHRLSSSGVGLFASAPVARRLAKNFPASLADAELLLPSRMSALRRAIDWWLQDRGLTPRVLAEFDDSALLKIFAESGRGAFPAPLDMQDDLKSRYGLHLVATLEGRTSDSFAVVPDRRHAHPLVERLFAD